MPRGFTILGTIISVAIFGLLIAVIGTLQVNVFSYNRLAEFRSEIDQRTILVLRGFSKEVRSAQQSHEGSYPLSQTNDTQVTFYSDAGADGFIEQIRYFVEDGILKKGTIIPAGQPLTYNPSDETLSELLSDIVGAGPFFYYYDETFNNVTSTEPLAQPISIQAVRGVELKLTVDPMKPKIEPITVNTKIFIRNLKTY